MLRRSTSRLLLPLGIAAAAMTAAPSAAAFCRSTTCVGECNRDPDNCKTAGQPLSWAPFVVEFRVASRGSEFIPFPVIEEVTQLSFVAWSDIPCATGTASIAFTRGPDTDCHCAEYDPGANDNENVILFQDTKWDYTGVDNTLAKTTVSYDAETGVILDADIELNHAFNEFTTGDDAVVYDLQSILTHEVGHFIGLDHTPDFAATMNAGYQEGTTEQRSLEPDDEAGACAAYPPGRDVAPPMVEEEGGCSVAVAGSPPPSTLPPWLLALAAGALSLRPRSRRRRA